MPRISGVYQLPPSYRAVSGETIRVEQHNPPLEDIAEALTGSLPRDGSAPMTADLKMGGNRITNVAAATTSTDAARFDQVEGKIAGPASATADAVPVFDGTTGKLIKDSAKLLPTGDIVGTTDTQTLSNKTLTAPLVNVGSDAPGDLYQRNAAGTGFERIAVGASGTALVSDGTKWAAGDLPSWTETTLVATTSGTAFDTVIPSGVTDIEVWLDGVSGNSTGDLLLQVGTGGLVTKPVMCLPPTLVAPRGRLRLE